MRFSAVLGLWALVALSLLTTCQPFALLYSTITNTGCGVNDNLRKEDPSKPNRLSWKERVHQLEEYREEHGHTLVPRRYPENPALGNWVNKQRQLYRKYLANETPCSLTSKRIEVLNSIGFCWDAASRAANEDFSLRESTAWWKKLEEFRIHVSKSEKLPPPLASWLRQQRQQYESYHQGEDSKLDKDKVKALDDINPNWWKSARRLTWEARMRELLSYRKTYGDCCVPISHENKKLANWVSNVRKNYNLKMAGRPSTLTSDQIRLLNKIGFVWNRWEHEYEKQLSRPWQSHP